MRMVTMIVVVMLGMVMVIVIVGGMVVVVVPATMIVAVPLRTQNKHGGAVNNQSDEGNGNGNVELDLDRVEEPLYTFPPHQQRKQDKENGACISRQGIHFPSAKAEAVVVGIFSGINVRNESNQQPNHMGSHVDPVC